MTGSHRWWRLIWIIIPGDTLMDSLQWWFLPYISFRCYWSGWARWHIYVWILSPCCIYLFYTHTEEENSLCACILECVLSYGKDISHFWLSCLPSSFGPRLWSETLLILNSMHKRHCFPFLLCFPSLINTLSKEPPLTSLDRPSNHCLPCLPDSCGTYWCVYIRDHCLFFPCINVPRFYSSGAAHPLRPALCLSVHQSELNSHHHS